jgi:hypothetical protein
LSVWENCGDYLGGFSINVRTILRCLLSKSMVNYFLSSKI